MTPEASASDQSPQQDEGEEIPVPKQRTSADESTTVTGETEPSDAIANDAEQIIGAGRQASSSPSSKTKAVASTDPESITGFSPAASTLYFGLVNRYIVDLERFSRFKAKWGSLEGVSKQHVAEAAAFLSSSRVLPKKLRYCETAGGVLLGAGVSELVALVQDKTLSVRLVIVTVALIAVGGVMIGMFLGRD